MLGIFPSGLTSSGGLHTRDRGWGNLANTSLAVGQLLDGPHLSTATVGDFAAGFDVPDDPAVLVADLQTATMAGVVDISHP